MRLSHPFEVTTPTVDGDVLAVLGRAQGPFSDRQIHRLIGQRSEAGIRKTLDWLVEQGLVLHRKVGGTHLHSLNQDHLAAEAKRSIARLREKVASLISEVLQAWDHPPAFAALFGSTARGE